MTQLSKSTSEALVFVDTLIKNATVFDGSGTIGNSLDVAIRDDRIFALGDLSTFKANNIIDATGLQLAPGFIDVHTHDDLEVIRNPKMFNKISQGVTTVVIGNCGISASPYVSNKPPVDPINLLGNQQEFEFSSLSAFIKKFEQVKPSVNAVALVGHTSLRSQVMSDLDRPATKSEIASMLEMLEQALSEGAKGLSTGLAYHNAIAAPQEEVEELVNLLSKYDAIYSTHLRTEFDGIIGALDEAFITAKGAKVPLVISHIKCAGTKNWGRAKEVVGHIEKHQEQQKISCDCYPYNASSSTLDLGQVTDEFEIFITWSESHPLMAGRTLAEIAKQWQVSLLDAAKKLQPAGAVYHGMNEDDVREFLSFKDTMIGSDGLPCDPHPHPRLWGTFPRVLGHYCREEELLSLASGIHKMTGLSAQNFKLKDRGLIKVGHFADLVLFDKDKISDIASFSDPFVASDGIHKVWVNGQLTLCNETKNIPKKYGAGRFLAHNKIEQ